MPTTEVTMSIRLPKELRDAFDNYCTETDQTKSQVLRLLIRDLLNTKKQPKLPL